MVSVKKILDWGLYSARQVCIVLYMSTGTQTPTRITEVWTVSTKRGIRYYQYNLLQLRAFPMPKAEAELKLATGAAVLIAKPSWLVGGRA